MRSTRRCGRCPAGLRRARCRCCRGSRHDRSHLARGLDDPAGGRPVRVLTVDRRAHGPGGRARRRPPADLGRAARLPRGAVFLGEADGVPYAAVRGERALTVSGRPVDRWAGLRELGADLDDLDAGLLAQAIGDPGVARPAPVQPAVRGGDDDRAVAAGCSATPPTGTTFFPRTDPAVIMLVHDGADRRGARPSGAVAARPVLDPGRLRGAGGVRRGGGRPGGGRGGRSARDRHPVRRQPAVALPAVADARLRRAGRRAGHPAPRSRPRSRRRTGSPARSCVPARGPQALPPPVSIARHIIDRWVAGEFD